MESIIIIGLAEENWIVESGLHVHI